MAIVKRLGIAAGLAALLGLGACAQPNNDRGVSATVDCSQPGITCSGGQRRVVVEGDFQVLATPATPTAAVGPCGVNPCAPPPVAAPPRAKAPPAPPRVAAPPQAAPQCVSGGCGTRTYLASAPPGIVAQPPAVVPCAGPCGARPGSTHPTSVLYYYKPRIDCKASGGVETINPETGRPSCAVTKLVLPGEVTPPWVKR